MWILLASFLVAIVVVSGGIAVYTYVRYRAARFVKCPENHRIEAVSVDAGEAALTAAIGNPQLRLAECTRWPEMKDCGQECVRQIEYAPEDCLVRNVVANWYRDKCCAVCGHTFGVVHWHDHAPALVDDQGHTVLWSDVPLAQLMTYLETHDAVCWDCHIVQTFRHDHPELVTYRKER